MNGRWRFVLILLAGLVCGAPAVAVARQSQPAPAAATPDPEADKTPPAPVLVGDDPVIWILAGAGPYAPALRADRITGRIAGIVRDRSLKDLTVTVTEAGGASELRVGTHLVMAVTQGDAAVLGVSRASLAQQFAAELQAAMHKERGRYAPGTLVKSGIYALVATIVFVAAVWVTMRLTRSLKGMMLRGIEARSESLRAIQEEVLSDGRIGRGLTAATRFVRLVVVVLLLDLYLTYVLGLFPWTSGFARKLLPLVITPVMAVVRAFVGYLPNLFFVIVIAAVFYGLIKLVGLFFRQIELGRLVFPNFPAEWADPTNKIVRVLLIAFGLVVAFPYLPASDSPAFAGVSVFIGVLFSLASSSALSNMIAGIVLTYTSAFRVGERVKVGDAFGDIIETSLLVTRVRTIKNENITIPNGIVLGSAVTNYSRAARTLGLILHTSVTIGYDAPWRKIHDLLLEAARGTPGILDEPHPFVWQTALNDFYVTYEINAYTDQPNHMIDIYAALHARIQDTFYAAGVEIMSPHFTAVRDGNTIAIPETSRPADYQAPSFRVSQAAAAVAGVTDFPGGTRRS
jgi:small-conductance mechanosensitive channel